VNGPRPPAASAASARDFDIELRLLLDAVYLKYQHDFRHYAYASLRRRMRQAMDRFGCETLSQLQSRLLHEPEVFVQLLEYFTVQVSEMFRDPAYFRAIRAQVVPLLRTYPFVKIWVAGCSTGEEVYSLAIVLEEEGLYDRCRLYATDISDQVVERARAGVFSLRHLRDHTVAYQKAGGRGDFSAYYQADAHNAVIRQALRRNIIFSQHNLVCDGPFNEFHLIMCRNVMIYFDMELRNRVHELLFNSLTKFGILSIGKKETLHATPFEDRFEEMGTNLKVYRRVR